MKKRMLLSLALMGCLALLAGCKGAEIRMDAFSGDSLSKAQKIVVADAAGNEKAVLAEKADIDAFADAVNAEGWRFEELPEDLTEGGSFTLWQEETITALLGEREAKANRICVFRIYQDGDYLTIETGLIDFDFAIPQEAADYLRGLAA